MASVSTTPEPNHSRRAVQRMWPVLGMSRSRSMLFAACRLSRKRSFPASPLLPLSRSGMLLVQTQALKNSWLAPFTQRVATRLHTCACSSSNLPARPSGCPSIDGRRRDGGLTRPRPLTPTGRAEDRGARRTGRRQSLASGADGSPQRGRQARRFHERSI